MSFHIGRDGGKNRATKTGRAGLTALRAVALFLFTSRFLSFDLLFSGGEHLAGHFSPHDTPAAAFTNALHVSIRLNSLSLYSGLIPCCNMRCGITHPDFIVFSGFSFFKRSNVGVSCTHDTLTRLHIYSFPNQSTLCIYYVVCIQRCVEPGTPGAVACMTPSLAVWKYDGKELSIRSGYVHAFRFFPSLLHSFREPGYSFAHPPLTARLFPVLCSGPFLSPAPSSLAKRDAHGRTETCVGWEIRVAVIFALRQFSLFRVCSVLPCGGGYTARSCFMSG